MTACSQTQQRHSSSRMTAQNASLPSIDGAQQLRCHCTLRLQGAWLTCRCRRVRSQNTVTWCYRELQDERRAADPATADAIEAVLDQLDACAAAERDFTMIVGECLRSRRVQEATLRLRQLQIVLRLCWISWAPVCCRVACQQLLPVWNIVRCQ